MKKAFTLIELVVAVALLAVVFAFAGLIFRVGIDSYRTSVANAEIMQKLRAITDQLNADFAGLRKDGEIFVIWRAEDGSHERFDRIMFFADGDFQSYGLYKNGVLDPSGDPVHGSVARICYMLANKPPPYANIGSVAPEMPGTGIQKPEERILARTQHILTTDAQFINAPLTPDKTTSSPLDWYNWNDVNEYDYDMNSLDKWKNVPWMSVSGVNKSDMLTVIAGSIDVTVNPSTIYPNIRGTMVAPADANLIHNLLCEGVGMFKVQGWSWDNTLNEWRWVPEWDNSDFYAEGSGQVPGVLYPYRAWFPAFPLVQINSIPGYPNEQVDEAHFNDIPGLGRALKFTFTLYDSRGIIKQGRTFTHIVYIGN